MFYRKYRKIILPALFLPLFLIVWELYIRLFHVPNYLLPGPAELADSMVKLFVSGDIMKHIRVTMEEILMGTVIGIVIGLILGYIMAKIRFIERLIMPFVIIIQTAPKISLAPLFILWMGLGIESKAALVILVENVASLYAGVFVDHKQRSGIERQPFAACLIPIQQPSYRVAQPARRLIPAVRQECM